MVSVSLLLLLLLQGCEARQALARQVRGVEGGDEQDGVPVAQLGALGVRKG